MYQRPEGLSDLIAVQMRCEGDGHAMRRQAERHRMRMKKSWLILLPLEAESELLNVLKVGHMTPGCSCKKRLPNHVT